MRPLTVAAAVAFIFLLTLSNARIALDQAQTPWIDQTTATDYVKNLLSWYNLDATNDPNFRLYDGNGHNFHVFVLEATPNNSTLTVFAFFPIQANDPQVDVISNSSFYDLTGLILHDNVTLEGAENGGTHFIIGNTTFVLTVIFATLTSNVLANTLANSEAFGKYLYRFDAAGVPPPNYVLDFLAAFWAYIVVGAGAIIALMTGLHYWVNNMWPFHKSGRSPKKKTKGRK